MSVSGPMSVTAQRKKAMPLNQSKWHPAGFVTDMLQGMRIVKLNAWEQSVEEKVQALRVKETTENAD